MLFAEKSGKRPSAKAADGHFSVSVQVLAQQLAQLVDQLAEQRQRVCQAANNCIEQHRRTIHTAELAALIAQRDALTA